MIAVIRRQVDGQGFGGHPTKRHPGRGVVVTSLAITVHERCFDKAILLLPRRREFAEESIAEGDVQRPFDPPTVETASQKLNLTAKFITGLDSVDLDRTADAVATEQSPLGAAQNLNGLDVHHIHERTRHLRNVDPVHVQGNAGLTGGKGELLADAADVNRGAGITRRRWLRPQGRHTILGVASPT